MPKHAARNPLASFAIALAGLASFDTPEIAAQGGLTPPGAPAPTQKTLTQVEPRVDLSTLPTSATAVISITQPGSYYASADMVGSALKNTIEVLVSGVTIDLNGFALTGTGTGSAAITGVGFSNLTVRNGRLVSGAFGVRGGIRLACADLIIEGNSGQGIFGGSDSLVERCRLPLGGILLQARGSIVDCDLAGVSGLVVGTASIVQRTRLANGGGIFASSDSQVLDCIVTNAGGDGIQAGPRNVIRNCIVNAAANSGIRAGDQSRLSHCTVRGAGITGSAGSDGGYVLGNDCFAEACAAYLCLVPGFNFLGSSSSQMRNCAANANAGAGFVAGSQIRLVDCTATENTGLGIAAGTRSSASGCVVSSNQAGGIYLTGVSTLVESCLSSGNLGGSGIRVDSGTVRDCEARQNQGGAGIRASTGSQVLRNTSSSNGIAATPQNGFLIEGGRSRVEGNHAYNNSGFGLEVTNTSATNSVLVIGNSVGTNDLGEFSIGAGNAVGPFLAPSSVLTNTIPTANFNL